MIFDGTSEIQQQVIARAISYMGIEKITKQVVVLRPIMFWSTKIPTLYSFITCLHLITDKR